MFLNKQPICSIDYLGKNKFTIHIAKKISDNDIEDLVSFLYTLSYQSPSLIDIIDQIKTHPKLDNKISNVILQKLTNLYLNDNNHPVIHPLTAFKQNAK